MDKFGKVFRSATQHQGVPIHIIRPDIDLKELDVDYTSATKEGLFAAYRHGEEKGKEFVDRMIPTNPVSS